MNNPDFITALKKHLSGIAKNSREEILMEINSHAEESDKSLYQLFGEPKAFAQKYLDDEATEKSVAEKAIGLSKNLFIALGITTLLLISGSYVFLKGLSQDDFNYADEQASELALDSSDWEKMAWSADINITVEQSQLVFYWNDSGVIAWSCKSDGPESDWLGAYGQKGSGPKLNASESIFNFRHKHCLVSLPQQKAKIKSRQGNIVVVRPQARVELEILQSKLRIAENEAEYRYQINKKRSNLASFKSVSSAKIEISISAIESKVEVYDY